MHVELEESLSDLRQRGFCWSIGSSRLSAHECRIYTMPQDDKYPRVSIIESGDSFREAVANALFRLGDRNLYLEVERR